MADSRTGSPAGARAGEAPHHDVAGYVLGTLAPAEAVAFEAHLAGCAQCRAEVGELGSLPDLLAGAAVAPPPDLRRRTFDAIAAAAAAEQARPAQPGPPPDQPQRPGQPQQWTHPQRQQRPGPPPQWPAHQQPPQPPVASTVVPLRSRRPAVRWLTAAAAGLLVVAAVGIGAVVLTRTDEATTGPSTTIALAAGDASDAGASRGEAVVRQIAAGREVRLEVSGLPANPPGTYYECWFVGAGDTEATPNRVSAGTFTVGADGTATVVMVSAADPARFPKMGVTLEPDDGNPARTGPKYLITP